MVSGAPVRSTHLPLGPIGPKLPPSEAADRDVITSPISGCHTLHGLSLALGLLLLPVLVSCGNTAGVVGALQSHSALGPTTTTASSVLKFPV